MRREIQYPQSQGSTAFDILIRELGLSNDEAGAEIRVSGTTIYHWRIGAKVPRPASRRAIEEWSRKSGRRRGLPAITPPAWDEPVEAVAKAA